MQPDARGTRSDELDPDGAGRSAREHLEAMIGSEQLAEHQRVFVALGGLAGLTAAPRWRLTSVCTCDGQPTKIDHEQHPVKSRPPDHRDHEETWTWDGVPP